jgi:hemolysin D
MGDGSLNATQRQFLPAALEVQDTPPSPAGRVLVWLLLSLFTIGILWACFGQVDIVVTAPGRIVPSGQVKIVQAPETGTILAIHIAEGERVTAGQILISLDPTYADADDLRISQQIDDLSLELSWRKALDVWLSSLEGQDSIQQSQASAEKLTAEAHTLYEQHRIGIIANLASLEKDREATRAELAMAVAEGQRVDATLPILG